MSDRDRPGVTTAASGDALDSASGAMEIARAVAGEAAELLRGAAGNVGNIRSKSNPRDLVTEWDTRCEDLIRERLLALTPDIPLLGEERGVSAASGTASDFMWLIDPIDGTVNFAHGLPYFGVAIALEHRGRAIAGAVYAPALGWEIWGARGHGSFMNGERMAVSTIAALDQALLITGFPSDRATHPQNNFSEWEHFQRKAGACRRLGAASLDLCLVARGWADGYWERRLNPWDISASALMVEEAGGQVSAYDAGPMVSAKGEIVASNGVIHGEILAELAACDRARAARPSLPE